MFQNRRRILIPLFLLLLAAVCVYIYYAFYQPLTLELQSKKRELQSEEKLIEALESQMGETPSKLIIATNNLQQRLPVKPMTDQLLLDFEKIELLSNSTITEMNFTDGEVEEEANLLEDAKKEETDTTNNSQADEQTTDQEKKKEQGEADTTAVPEVLPAGIEKISAQLTVESDSYAEMETFLAELEQQIRILNIEQLIFDGPEESEKLEGTDEPLVYDVTVAAYYMPELLSLMQDVPKVDTPNPAKKEDPFVKIND
ncbi:hypothetical protein [Bacillus sp. FJAT-27231]|uniref:hypothetical protein n=1 Tax=Bacillus sp. FJAT-27231 TaxID=1679168 RepID=UPI0012E0F353|nr:hypothetical protein [Bacillus sp. FJAT-27231]